VVCLLSVVGLGWYTVAQLFTPAAAADASPSSSAAPRGSAGPSVQPTVLQTYDLQLGEPVGVDLDTNTVSPLSKTAGQDIGVYSGALHSLPDDTVMGRPSPLNRTSTDPADELSTCAHGGLTTDQLGARDVANLKVGDLFCIDTDQGHVVAVRITSETINAATMPFTVTVAVGSLEQ